MKTIRIIVCGCGSVGKQFLTLLAERQRMIARDYQLQLILQAAVDINGAAVATDGNGLDVTRLLEHLGRGAEVQDVPEYGKPGMSGPQVIDSTDAEVLVEMTPTSLIDGGPGKDHVFAALEKGLEVVSANKGPFVLFYREILEKARQNACGIHISAATAAALPTLDVGLTCLSGATVQSIEGILNGTSNFILTKMTLDSATYDSALKEAQQLGIAETDPSYDVEGKDTANKMILIANRLFNKTYGLADISVKGITGITPEQITEAGRNNQVIKLVGTAKPAGDEWQLSVTPQWLDTDHPLASINNSEKAITYMTDTMGGITVSGGKSSPTGAAAAVLKDLINAFRD